ncbi:MAG TPA: thioredoxin family protein [Chloroflexota bacterium]|nr:thioredoxin family protein [Chloroflexota bacterium]
MAFISDKDRASIAKMFEENLGNPVRLILFTIPPSPLFIPGRPSCETCKDVQQLIEEIASLSDKLTLEIHNLEREREVAERYGITRVPALLVASGDEGRVRYFGAPAGYEFSTLIQDIQAVSKHQTALSQATRDALAAIDEPIHLQVFVTPT